VELLADDVDPGALFEDQAARKPAEGRLAPGVVVVGAGQVALHGPGADQAVQAPQRGVGLREVWLSGMTVPP
jgi:hypothetical protein